ncbi:MAG TPA: hypothetical protein VF885_12965 [Arthrobacter sp.]
MRVLLSGMVTSLLLLAGLAAAPGLLAAEARPNADEECVMQCDEESDKCMRQAGADEERAKACDDKYAECLKKCR